MCTCYKYNITLYNLTTKKYRKFVTCVYCYRVIIIFYYKTSDSKKKNSKISDCYMNYLCMDECGYMGQ